MPASDVFWAGSGVTSITGSLSITGTWGIPGADAVGTLPRGTPKSPSRASTG